MIAVNPGFAPDLHSVHLVAKPRGGIRAHGYVLRS
jgi:hypothetical protein